MQTKEIPRREWPTFLDAFTRQHEGWLANVGVLGPDIGAQVEVEGLPLVGVTAELQDGEDDAIAIVIGGTGPDHVTHTVLAPTHVRLEQTEAGADQALQIESADGLTTLIRFRSAILPEMVDGAILE